VRGQDELQQLGVLPDLRRQRAVPAVDPFDQGRVRQLVDRRAPPGRGRRPGGRRGEARPGPPAPRPPPPPPPARPPPPATSAATSAPRLWPNSANRPSNATPPTSASTSAPIRVYAGSAKRPPRPGSWRPHTSMRGRPSAQRTYSPAEPPLCGKQYRRAAA